MKDKVKIEFSVTFDTDTEKFTVGQSSVYVSRNGRMDDSPNRLEKEEIDRIEKDLKRRLWIR